MELEVAILAIKLAKISLKSMQFLGRKKFISGLVEARLSRYTDSSTTS
jgi:hypothetical protein